MADLLTARPSCPTSNGSRTPDPIASHRSAAASETRGLFAPHAKRNGRTGWAWARSTPLEETRRLYGVARLFAIGKQSCGPKFMPTRRNVARCVSIHVSAPNSVVCAYFRARFETFAFSRPPRRYRGHRSAARSTDI